MDWDVGVWSMGFDHAVTFYQNVPPPVDGWIVEWSEDGNQWQVIPSDPPTPSAKCWEMNIVVPGDGYVRSMAFNEVGVSDPSNLKSVPETGLIGLFMGIALLICIARGARLPRAPRP
jgi:hypothetical protein